MFDAMWRNAIKRNIVVASAFKSFKHLALFLRETLRVKNPTHELLKNKNLLEQQTQTRFSFSVSSERNRSRTIFDSKRQRRLSSMPGLSVV